MKLLHTADLHLGALNKRLTPTKATAVKDEQILQIGDFFEYAKQNSVEAILISGDLFHNKIIPLKTQKVFFDYVRNSGIKTFYLRGNHDKEYFSKQLMPDNFIMFEEELETYSFDKFTISGQQACAKMQKPIFLDDKFHFMMLHGDIYNRNSQDGIDLEYYKNLKINYLALGHIHNFSSGNLDKDGVYVYSGSMFSNGFDECGEKGFVEIEIKDNKLNYAFKKFAKREYKIVQADITDKISYNQIKQVVEKNLSSIPPQNIVRLVLQGYYKEESEKYISLLEKEFADRFYYFEIVDKTKIKIDIEKIKREELSFKAEFLKLVETDKELSEEEKNMIIKLGIEALRGDELSI